MQAPATKRWGSQCIGGHCRALARLGRSPPRLSPRSVHVIWRRAKAVLDRWVGEARLCVAGGLTLHCVKKDFD